MNLIKRRIKDQKLTSWSPKLGFTVLKRRRESQEEEEKEEEGGEGIKDQGMPLS